MSVELQPLVKGTDPLFSNFAQASFGAYDKAERPPCSPDRQEGPFKVLLDDLREYYDAAQIGDYDSAAGVTTRIRHSFDELDLLFGDEDLRFTPKVHDRLGDFLDSQCQPDSFYRIPDELPPQRPPKGTSFLEQMIIGASVIVRGGDEEALRRATTFGHAVGALHAFEDTPWTPDSIADDKEREQAEIAFKNIKDNLNKTAVHAVGALAISPDDRRSLLEAAGIDLEKYGD